MNLLTKITLFIHRILGTAFSILFLVWFLSGLVMIYHTFPRADRADKRAKMDILSPENLPSLDQIEKADKPCYLKQLFGTNCFSYPDGEREL